MHISKQDADVMLIHRMIGMMPLVVMLHPQNLKRVRIMCLLRRVSFKHILTFFKTIDKLECQSKAYTSNDGNSATKGDVICLKAQKSENNMSTNEGVLQVEIRLSLIHKLKQDVGQEITPRMVGMLPLSMMLYPQKLKRLGVKCPPRMVPFKHGLA